MGLAAVTVLVFCMYRLLSRRSFKTRYNILMLAANIIYRLWRSGRHKLKCNLALIVPSLNKIELEAAAREVVRTIVRDWAALLGANQTEPSDSAQLMDIQGVEKILAHVHVSDGRVVADKVVIAPIHMGSFGAAMDAVSLFQVPAYGPAERITPGYLLNLMMRLRSNRFLKMEPLERGKTYAKMVRRMSCGWAIAVMVDMLSRRMDRGVVCRVGGARGRFETGAVRLAVEHGAKIFPAFVLWTGEKYRIVVEDQFEPVLTGDTARDIEVNTRRLIEERVAPWIEKYPGQWMQALWANLEPARDVAQERSRA